MAETQQNDLGLRLQRMGAGFAGNLAQFDAARAAQEENEFNRQLQRDERNRALSIERQRALAQDAQTVGQFLEMGETGRAIELLDNRLQMIGQLGGDPSDTQEIRNMIASGDVDGAAREINLFTTEAVTRGLIKPIAGPQAASTAGKQAQDEGLRPGTLAFAARVQELSRPEPKQARIVEQNGVQYWADGPKAGQPVIAGAKAEEPSIVEQYQKRFGAIPANMTPEVRDGDITGALVPIPGSEADPATIERKRLAEIEKERPEAQKALASLKTPFESIIREIKAARGDPNTADVVGPWEGMGPLWGENKLRLNPLTADANATADARIKGIKNLAKVIGVQLTRQASKTGSAGGQITEREWPIFEAMIANLNTTMDEPDFFKQLDAAEAKAVEILSSLEGEFQSKYGGQDDPLGIRY